MIVLETWVRKISGKKENGRVPSGVTWSSEGRGGGGQAVAVDNISESVEDLSYSKSHPKRL